MKRIHLLKPGTFVAEDGKSYTFTGDDIRSIAKSYNPALSEAPIVVGHPDTDAPAYGWIGKVVAENDDLFVEPSRVNPAFAQSVVDGAYKKVSAKLWGPDHPGNPAPGQWYLQHVGFLGGKAPAVKGLQPIQFSGREGVAIEVPQAEKDAPGHRLVELLLRALGHTNPMLSADTVAAIQAAAIEPVADPKTQTADPSLSPSLSEQSMTDTKLAEENAALKKKLADIEAANVAAKRKAHQEAAVAFVEGAVKAGKVLPAERGLMVELATRIDAGTTVALAAGETPVDLLDSFKAFVNGLPERVKLGAVAGGKDVLASAPAFAAPAGCSVSATRADLHARINQYLAANPNVSYEAAASIVEAAG